MRTPDSPENYNAFKDSQRQQSEKRQLFRVVTWLKDNDSSPDSDRQVAERVAKQTGGAPAREDIVRAYRDLFREADNRAWAEKIGKESPITLASMGDPNSRPISKTDAETFASIERALFSVGRTPSTFGSGATLRGDRVASAPVPTLKKETALPSLMPPNPTRSVPVAVPPEAKESKGIPSVGASVGAPTSGLATVPVIEGSGQAYTVAGAGAEAHVNIQAIPPSDGDEAVNAPPSIKDFGGASAIAGAGTQASVNATPAGIPEVTPDEKVPGTTPSVEGGGRAFAKMAPGAQASVGADVREESEAVTPGVGGAEATVESPSTERNNVGAPDAENFVPIGGWLVQPSEDQRISPEGVKGFVASSIDILGRIEEFIGRVTDLSPENIAEIERIANSIAYAKAEDYDKLRAMASQQYFYYYQDLYKELDAVIFEHKDPQEVLKYLSEVRLDAQRTAQAHLEHGKYLQNYARANWAAEPGQESSFPRMVGEAAPDILAGLSIPRVAGMLGLALYGALRSGGNAVSGARMAGASEAEQTEAGLWGAGWGALTSFSLTDKMAKIPFGRNALGRAVGTILAGGVEGLQQASQKFGENMIALWKFNKDQNVLEGVGPAFLGGAITSYVGTFIKKVNFSAQNYASLKYMSAEVGSWRVNGGEPEALRAFLGNKLKGSPAEYIYISPNEFSIAMKEIGENPRDVLRRIMGGPIPDFSLAVSSGADLRIPTASYLVEFAGMKEGEAVLRRLRFDPADMTWAEAEKHSEEARRALEKIAKDVPQWKADVPNRDVPPAPDSAPPPDTGSSNPAPKYPHESAKGKTEHQRENDGRREAEARQRADGAKIRENNTTKKREAAKQHKLEKMERQRAFWETQRALSEGPKPSTDKDALMRSVSPWSPF